MAGMDCESNEEMRRQKLAAAEQQKCSTETAGKAPFPSRLGACAEPREEHAHRLRGRLMVMQYESVNAAKALSILERHPEFEEFLWLLRSGLV